MKKKLVSLLLASALAVTALAGCGDETSVSTETPTSVSKEDTSTSVEETADIPEAVYYYSFDEADGTDGIVNMKQDASDATSGQRGYLVEGTDGVTFIPGVKGDAVYTNGNSGYKLTDINGLDGETYTVSFWIYATRFANYMPTIQYGPHVFVEDDIDSIYLNITRTEFPGDATFPTIWPHDGNNTTVANNWPWWAAPDADEHLNEWCMVTLVVDGNNLYAADNETIIGQVYINGEEVINTDSDGNVVPCYIVPGTMAKSDTFDFLVGVNYWDACFKGAFDELYVFDKALTAAEVKALYNDGDPTVAYEAPERVIVPEANPDAITSVGSLDFSNGWWSDWTESFELNDGDVKEISLKNFSDGINTYDNYVLVFTNEANEKGQDPNTVSDSHVEYCAVRADAAGWCLNGTCDISDDSFTYSWDNWNTWRQQVMVEADVTITLERNGKNITMTADNVDYNGTSNTMTANFNIEVADEETIYFCFTCEESYVDVLSVKDGVKIVPDENAIETLGNTDYTNAWWTEWSTPLEIKDGETKVYTLNNYSDGVNNYDNYVLMFTNEYTEPHQNPNYADGTGAGSENHVEYGAIRADAWAWNDTFTTSGTFSTDWDSFRDTMKQAKVVLTVTRKDNIITVAADVTGRNGETFSNETVYTSTVLTADAPCYVIVTCEECYLEILSIE